MKYENIKLKRATVEDIGSILEVEKSVIGTKIYSGLSGSDDTVKEITENIFYLIEKAGKIVGDVAYQMKDENHAYISGVAVAKEFQRQGIAREAMKILLKKLKDIKLIDLVTHPENEKAIKLYESLGFEKIGSQMENYFDDGEPRIKMVFKK
jgi:ribosomal-protein-alanine N-acetyltransferase